MVVVTVVSEKGREFVGDLDADVDTPELVFKYYSRDKYVLDAAPDPQGRAATLVEATQGERGSVAGLRDYLVNRNKAAIAEVGDDTVCLLPRKGFVLAVYSSAKKRKIEPSVVKKLDVPLWRDKKTSDAMVFMDDDGTGVYFQDARRRYEFRCGRQGLELLAGLVDKAKQTLVLLDDELEGLENRDALLAEGRRIYAEKPSLRKFGASEGKNVTWSNDEYAHVGLRAQYLRLKSLQRYTETYNLLERAVAVDAVARGVLRSSTKLRVASVGGGPAFELVALADFVSATPELYSLDLQPAWKPYAEALGCEFAQVDVNQATPKSLIDACGGKPLDILVVSYLLIYCTNERTADLLADLLRQRLVSVLLISERTHIQGIVNLLRKRHIAVIPLMPQTRETDHRQLLALLDPKPLGGAAAPTPVTFFNVPFARGT